MSKPQYFKHYEHILAVKAESFTSKEALQEVSLSNHDSIFAQRKWLELDPSWRQIIPYVLVENSEGKYLVYRRTKNSGEKGLVNKWSIGAGGHIDLVDVVVDDGGAPDIRRTIYKGTVRELQEELGLSGDIDFYELSHRIVSFASKTDMVHVGAVYKIKIDEMDIGEVEDKLDLIGFLAPDEIEKQGAELNEVWVKELLPVLRGEFDCRWSEVQI